MTIVDTTIVTTTDDRSRDSPGSDTAINSSTSNSTINAPASNAATRDSATVETPSMETASTAAPNWLRNGLNRSRCPIMRYREWIGCNRRKHSWGNQRGTGTHGEKKEELGYSI